MAHMVSASLSFEPLAREVVVYYNLLVENRCMTEIFSVTFKLVAELT
jgi:hypothetical protein